MDIFLIVFIIGSFGALIGGFIMEGGSPGMLVGLTPFIIVIGGTFGAVGVSFPKSELVTLPKVLGVLFRNVEYDAGDLIEKMKAMCIKVRKNGLLCLEPQIEEEPDSLMRKGMRMIVDGASSEYIRETLELSLEIMADRHRSKMEMFSGAAGFAPTMGILGTVMGLVMVLSNLSEPAALGEKISTAFIATLYGVGIANVVFHPMAGRLRQKNAKEVLYKSLIIEGLLLIQEGVSTNTLEEKLCSFLSDAELVKRNM